MIRDPYLFFIDSYEKNRNIIFMFRTLTDDETFIAGIYYMDKQYGQITDTITYDRRRVPVWLGHKAHWFQDTPEYRAAKRKIKIQRLLNDIE